MDRGLCFIRRGFAASAVFLLAATAALQAQFYAPETQYHDLSQRFFPVEAARVLAWLEHQTGAPVAQVDFVLRRSDALTNEWQIRWLNARGVAIRTVTLGYPRSALTNGTEFYRAVFRQLGGTTNRTAGPAVSAGALEKAFWEGADRAGCSRMESLEAAFDVWKLVRRRFPSSSEAARLAGLLAQTPAHGWSAQSALDGWLLARSAAWLCVAEGRGAPNSALWAPILFSAGRERQAEAAWRRSTNDPVAAWWNVLLTRAPADDAFLFAATPEQRSRALPMMACQARIADGYAVAAGQLLEPMFGDQTRSFMQLYDYAPMLAEGSAEIVQAFDGWWPVMARAAWVRTLKAFPAGDLDFQGYQAALAEAEIALTEKPDLAPRLVATAPPGETDNATRQLDAVAPLLRLAYREASGPLAPVAHVTARDLLHFGWENAVTQIMARHSFVNQTGGAPEVARAILKEAAESIPAFAPLVNGATNDPARAEPLERLQFVTGTVRDRWPAARSLELQAPGTNASPLRVRWLQPVDFSPLREQPAADRKALLAALHAEGGRRLDLELLNFLAADGTDEERALFASEFSNNVPSATASLCDLLDRVNAKRRFDAEFRRQVEALFWTNPNSSIAPRVFAGYIAAGELPAAKTFFEAVKEWKPLQPQRWTLAMLEGDQTAMAAALKVNDRGNSQEFLVRVFDAVNRQDWQQAEALAQEGVKRYGAGTAATPSLFETVRGVLSQRDALANSADARHPQALEFLASDTRLGSLQWILIRQLKLSPADAAIFLGGDQAQGDRKLMIQYLRGDRKGFEETFGGSDPGRDADPLAGVVVAWMRADLLGLQPKLDGKSLRPKSTATVEQRVLDLLQRQTYAPRKRN